MKNTIKTGNADVERRTWNVVRFFTPSWISQLFFLALFLYLFIITDYRGRDEINVGVNSFFRMDPLVLVSHVLAAKSLTWLLFPALLMVLFTVFL